MTIEARINGRLVLSAEIKELPQGAWSARVEADTDAAITGPCTITLGAVAWSGTAEGELLNGRAIVRVVGGAGGLKQILGPKHYYQPTVAMVVSDLARETGELVDALESDPVAMTTQLVRFTRLRMGAGSALTQLVHEMGGLWRVTRRGTVMVRKSEAWDEIAMEGVVLARDRARGTMEVAPEDAPLLRPGVRWQGEGISEVTTLIEANALRQRVTLQTGAPRPRTPTQAIQDAARRAVEAPLNFSQWYPARVVAQDADGTVQILADDERIQGNGITRVPLRHGLPGCKVRVAPGQKVVLFFENSDPKRPAAGLWPDGSSVKEVILTAESRVVIGGPAVLIGSPSASQAMVLGDALVDWLKTHTHPTAMGPSQAPLEQVTLPGVLSTKHKLDA